MTETVLVTGGAEYIGSHVCKALAAAEMQPICFDNLSRGNEWAVKWGPLEVGDITDERRIIEVIKAHNPVAVLHFAALAYVEESLLKPEEYYRVNVGGSSALLRAMEICGVHKIVFSSSCATYGEAVKIPIREDHPQKPVSPYGRTKLIVEQMLKDFENAHGLNWVALRYFNVAGADPDGEIGESHDPETHLIPNVIRSVDEDDTTFNLYGADFDTLDGTAVRDFIHVSDLADAHVQALLYLLEGNQSIALNLGAAKGHSVREVLILVERHTNSKINVEFQPKRIGDPPYLIAESNLAQKLLGWEPRRSDMETIIDTALKWSRKSPAD